VKAAAIIPARWDSSRFPGKPLHLILGKPLVQHVWDRCQAARSLDLVIVATDDMRIAEAALAFGAEVALTSPHHPSGTDRVAEVAARLRGYRHIINVQGDEPALDPRLIDQLVKTLRTHPKIDMVTAACPFKDQDAVRDPNTVKVVTSLDGRALYFSRSPIPFVRNPGYPKSKIQNPKFLWHIGLYGYRRDFLARFVTWKPTPLECAEKLEQLRALEHGASIHVVATKAHGVGVDTPGDVSRAEAALKLLRRRKPAEAPA